MTTIITIKKKKKFLTCLAPCTPLNLTGPSSGLVLSMPCRESDMSHHSNLTFCMWSVGAPT